MTNNDAIEFPWFVRCYYTDDVKPPKRPGGLAIETVHRTEVSRDIEIKAAESRSDIEVIRWGRR